MARIGLYPALIVVVFGIVAPFFIFRFGRVIGFAPLLVVAFVLGLGYGAVKPNILGLRTERSAISPSWLAAPSSSPSMPLSATAPAL